ncbi:MAG: hypothetical protein ABIZ50_03880 [Solirubrobacterales bacterium]
MGDSPVRELFWDGARLSLDPAEGGRSLCIDGRCLDADAVPGCFAHVCALSEVAARIPFDQPEVQEARRAALAWWIPLLGDALVCLSTFSLDSVHCAGAVTVARHPHHFDQDPFARLFAGTTLRTDLFGVVAAPAGPLIERIAGAPWPGGRFSASA